MYIQRAIERSLLDQLKPGKVLLLIGARRVGKTTLIERILNQIEEPFLQLHGEDQDTIDLLEHRSIGNYKRLLGGTKLLVIDEAQFIPDIGLKLKLMVDTIENLKIIATGSSAFDLRNKLGEPLVGRKISYHLFSIAQMELRNQENLLQTKSNLEDRLIFGAYPELFHLSTKVEKIGYLKAQLDDYLLRDILGYEGINKRGLITSLLRKVAFRVGSELSLEGLGNELQISKNTVGKYLDLLTKVFVLHKVSGFSRNLDNEITKKHKWYFLDNGIRNALISNFNGLELRDDTGKLWENYLISERIKYQYYRYGCTFNNYFWRTHTQQEIDWVEERDGALYAFDMKWKKKASKIPAAWLRAYPDALFTTVYNGDYLDFIGA